MKIENENENLHSRRLKLTAQTRSFTHSTTLIFTHMSSSPHKRKSKDGMEDKRENTREQEKNEIENAEEVIKEKWSRVGFFLKISADVGFFMVCGFRSVLKMDLKIEKEYYII